MKMSFDIFVVLSDNLYYYNIIHIKFQFYLKEWKTNLKKLGSKKRKLKLRLKSCKNTLVMNMTQTQKVLKAQFSKLKKKEKSQTFYKSKRFSILVK
jgi:hypothetical protein